MACHDRHFTDEKDEVMELAVLVLGGRDPRQRSLIGVLTVLFFPA